MKKLTLIIFTLIMGEVAHAQTQSDSIKETYTKIHNLENRISLQDSRITKLIQQVDEVTKQNLALKKNLNLTPTIATAKAGDIMEYRIIEVTGDTATNEVHLVITSDNIGKEEKEIRYYSFKAIDEIGHGYNNHGKSRLKVKDVSNDLVMNRLTHYPNAPYTLDLYFYSYDPESMYIKLLELIVIDGRESYSVIFENLPIKWNN